MSKIVKTKKLKAAVVLEYNTQCNTSKITVDDVGLKVIEIPYTLENGHVVYFFLAKGDWKSLKDSYKSYLCDDEEDEPIQEHKIKHTIDATNKELEDLISRLSNCPTSITKASNVNTTATSDI